MTLPPSMAVALSSSSEEVRAGARGENGVAVDPLRFLAGRHYICYCGRSVVGTLLCPTCAEEMVAYFVGAAERRSSGGLLSDPGAYER
jgi:hypothetical protein